METNPKIGQYFLGPVIILFLLILIAPSLIGVYAIYDTERFMANSDNSIILTQFLIDINSSPAVIHLTSITQVVPALLLAVCLKREDNSVPTIFGWLSFFILICGFLLSLLVLFLVNPGSVVQYQNFPLKKEGLQTLWDAAENTLTFCMAYLSVLLGINVKVARNQNG